MPTKSVKSPMDIKSLARSHTDQMIRVLVSIAGQAKAQPGARVAAATALLDRGWGKAPQQLTGEDGGDIRVVIRQIIDNAVQSIEDDSKVIEHDDDPATA